MKIHIFMVLINSSMINVEFYLLFQLSLMLIIDSVVYQFAYFFHSSYSAEEIEKKVSMFRKMLMEKEGVSERVVERDENGRPM